MKVVTFLPAALLMAALAGGGMAYAQEAGDAPPKEPGKKGWEQYHHDEMWSALPEEKRKLLRDTMEKTRKENMAMHEQMRKLEAQLDAIEVAPQFDSDAYLKKSTEIDELHTKMNETQKQSFASILGQFSQEERVELVVAEHMMKMMKHHHHDGEDWHGEQSHRHRDEASPHTQEKAE